MKLVFSKNEQLEISVIQKDDDNEKEFNYIDMIKNLIDVKSLEDPEIVGNFSESEKDSIISMTEHINFEVAEFYSDDKE